MACGEHGVIQGLVPWAGPRSRFTLLFERLAIDVLSDVSGGIAKHARSGVGSARMRRRRPRAIGYLTLVCAVDEGTVEHIAEDRKQESLDRYYAGLTQAQLDGLEAVAMDMWEPYIQATRAQLPDADEKIVFDRFHVMGHVGKAVDTVRKQEHRALMASGDETLTARTVRTCDSTAGRTYRSDGAMSLLHCCGRNSRSDGRGPSKRRGARCGTTSIPRQAGSSGAVALLGHAQPTGADSQASTTS